MTLEVELESETYLTADTQEGVLTAPGEVAGVRGPLLLGQGEDAVAVAEALLRPDQLHAAGGRRDTRLGDVVVAARGARATKREVDVAGAIRVDAVADGLVRRIDELSVANCVSCSSVAHDVA